MLPYASIFGDYQFQKLSQAYVEIVSFSNQLSEDFFFDFFGTQFFKSPSKKILFVFHKNYQNE